MFRFTRLIAMLAVTAALGACTASAPAPAAPPDTTADIAAIGTLRANFMGTVAAGDAAKMMSLYTSDAVVMTENETAKTGAGIQDYYTKLFAANTASVTITPDETKVSGDWGFDRGQFTFALTPKAKGGMAMTEHGKYIVIVQKQGDGSWKVAREIGNSNEMMMMPMTMPAAKK